MYEFCGNTFFLSLCVILYYCASKLLLMPSHYGVVRGITLLLYNICFILDLVAPARWEGWASGMFGAVDVAPPLMVNLYLMSPTVWVGCLSFCCNHWS